MPAAATPPAPGDTPEQAANAAAPPESSDASDAAASDEDAAQPQVSRDASQRSAADTPNGKDKVTICHATGADGKWVENRPDRSGDLNGHVGHQDGRDIIPPFTYEEDGEMVEFPGQNWDEDGIAVYENGCATPGDPDPEYSTPAVELVADQCEATTDELPETVTAHLSSLNVGQSYLLTVTVSGSEPVELPIVTAVATTAEVPVPVTGVGEYTVSATRVGASGEERSGVASVTVVSCPEEPAPVSICHATGMDGKWVLNSPATMGQLLGHVGHQDGRDIIPPFTYEDDGQMVEFPGQNWDEDGIAAYENGCEAPEPPVPSIRIEVEQCTVAGGELPTELVVVFENTLPSLDYELTVIHDGEESPVRLVRGAGAEGSVTVPISAAGTYEVVLSHDDVSDTATVDVAPCPDVDFDLSLVKSALVEGAVEVGDVIRYSLTVAADGTHAALQPVVTDSLPDGLVFAGGVSAPDGWSVNGGETVTATFAGAFSGTAVIEFDAMVTSAPALGEVINRACVSSDGAATEGTPERTTAVEVGGAARDASLGDAPRAVADSDPGNDCGEATTPVRSVTVAGGAECVNDTPWFSYSVTPSGIADPAGLPIALIWWSPEAYAARDAGIPAADHAAILADGAAQVDTIPYPSGWVSGQPLSGVMLWPGASVDSAGNPTGWPGWTQRADGTWFEDPSAPFYDLRGETIVEIRINPTASATTVYPPATPDCAARPPETVPPAVVPVDNPNAAPPVMVRPAAAAQPIAATGSEAPAALGLIAAGLLAVGVILSSARRRRTVRPTRE